MNLTTTPSRCDSWLRSTVWCCAGKRRPWHCTIRRRVARRLTASVWPDQRARHQRLKGAFQLAQRIPATVDKARAGEWLAVQLPDRPAGLTVVTHSIVWRYLSAEEQTVVMDLLKQHGAQATSQRPLAWVRHEPAPPRMTYDGKPYPVTVTEWPGGQTSVVATAHAHGQQMEWGQS